MTKVFVYDEQTITFGSHKLSRWSVSKQKTQFYDSVIRKLILPFYLKELCNLSKRTANAN